MTTRRARTCFASLLAAVLLGACGGSESSSRFLRSTQEDRLLATSGAVEIYRSYCATCHGTDGTPAVAAVRNLRQYDRPFSRFDTALSQGPGIMPMFPQLDSTARARLYEYIRTL